MKDLQEQNKKLRQLLKETLNAMCSYRAEKGFCTNCTTSMFCLSKKVIPKVEQVLKLKGNKK